MRVQSSYLCYSMEVLSGSAPWPCHEDERRQHTGSSIYRYVLTSYLSTSIWRIMFTFVTRMPAVFSVSTLSSSRTPGTILTLNRYSLYGVTSVQTITYYRQNHRDPKVMKCLVSAQRSPALLASRALIVHFGSWLGWISLVSLTVYFEVWSIAQVNPKDHWYITHNGPCIHSVCLHYLQLFTHQQRRRFEADMVRETPVFIKLLIQ